MTDEPWDSPEPANPHPEMHFPLIESAGGIYDDDAFIAGWNCAILDAKLSTAARLHLIMTPQVLQKDLYPQLDLIAMRYGMVTEAYEGVDLDPDLAIYTFVPPEYAEGPDAEGPDGSARWIPES